MTDRWKGVTVTFDHDIRKDDAKATVAVIKQLKGVIDVQGSVVDVNDYMNRNRVTAELSKKLWAVLHPEKGG